MYGRVVAGFDSVGHTINTLLVVVKGSFNLHPLLDHHPVFTHFYMYSYYASTYGLFIAFTIAILQTTYRVSKSARYFKASMDTQDYEMIEFMLKRFKLWAGIKDPKPVRLLLYILQ